MENNCHTFECKIRMVNREQFLLYLLKIIVIRFSLVILAIGKKTKYISYRLKVKKSNRKTCYRIDSQLFCYNYNSTRKAPSALCYNSAICSTKTTSQTGSVGVGERGAYIFKFLPSNSELL